MDLTIQRPPAALVAKPVAVRVPDLRPWPVEVVGEPPAPPQRALGGRAVHRLLRVLLTLGIGIAGTLAWQAFGDDARQMMAMAYPEQLGWIAPQAAPAAPAAPGAPAALASAAATAPSIEQQQLNALSLNLAAVRQGMEQLATQVAMGQQQMSGDIAKLQAAEQDILNKIAAPPPRPAPVAARKPAPPPTTAAAPSAPTPAAPSVR